jgi:hypothetical protein
MGRVGHQTGRQYKAANIAGDIATPASLFVPFLTGLFDFFFLFSKLYVAVNISEQNDLISNRLMVHPA